MLHEWAKAEAAKAAQDARSAGGGCGVAKQELESLRPGGRAGATQPNRAHPT